MKINSGRFLSFICSLFASALLLTSCNEVEDSLLIRSRFTHPFPKRSVNLERITGSRFCLLKNGDTIKYNVKFNKSDRTNQITVIEAADTNTIKVVSSRHRNLVFLNYPLKDSLWYLSAFSLTDSSLTGFNEVLSQMQKVDSWVYAARFKKLIVEDKSNFLLLLDPNNGKKETYELFSKILSEYPSYRIACRAQENKQNTAGATEEVKEIQKEEVFRYFPNPASNQITVITKVKRPIIVIRTEEDEILFQQSYSQDTVHISLAGIASGNYILSVGSIEERISQSARLMIKK